MSSPPGRRLEMSLRPRHQCDALRAEHRRRHVLPVPRCEGRLVIEEIEARWAAGHEQIDDVLGARREVRAALRGR